MARPPSAPLAPCKSGGDQDEAIVTSGSSSRGTAAEPKFWLPERNAYLEPRSCGFGKAATNIPTKAPHARPWATPFSDQIEMLTMYRRCGLKGDMVMQKSAAFEAAVIKRIFLAILHGGTWPMINPPNSLEVATDSSKQVINTPHFDALSSFS
jgi:hypothetical protein